LRTPTNERCFWLAAGPGKWSWRWGSLPDGKRGGSSISKTRERCAAVLEAIHYVIKGEKILKGAGLRIDVIPVPREISSDCGMALEFSCHDRDRVERLLADADITAVRIYALQKGQYAEV